MILALPLSCSFVEVIQMKARWLALAPLSLALGLVFVSPALADHKPGHHTPPGHTPGGFSDPRHEGPGQGVGHHTGDRGNSGHPAYGHVPELDPGLIGSAAVLLIGGMLVLRGRRPLDLQP
jgi:hypothetical protein